MLQLSAERIPRSVSDTLSNPKWKAAMLEEMTALDKNGTWEIVDLPDGNKPMGCKWVYTIK